MSSVDSLTTWLVDLYKEKTTQLFIVHVRRLTTDCGVNVPDTEVWRTFLKSGNIMMKIFQNEKY